MCHLFPRWLLWIGFFLGTTAIVGFLATAAACEDCRHPPHILMATLFVAWYLGNITAELLTRRKHGAEPSTINKEDDV